MKYKIYELTTESHLCRLERDGYDTKEIAPITLTELPYFSGLCDSFNSVTEANEKIIEKREDLKNKNLTIIPVISINYDGCIIE